MGKISVTDYLVRELHKLGIEDFFGLPGDFNFNILYSIGNNPNVNWIGCTNELNAGYAADGYARIKGYGALVTTVGVGELSAINAIAGSFAENIPVIKIVGVPATKFIKEKAILHHNFQHPDYYAFERAYSNVVETTAFLDEENAKSEIDRILSVFIKHQRPVYVAIPVDTCKAMIDDTPYIQTPQSDPRALKDAVEHALKLIDDSKYPLILGDVLIKRYKAKKEFNSFMEASQLPVSNLLMGKGIIEAKNKMYLGTFLSKFENLNAYNGLQDSDCVICVGVINSDLNTYRTGLPCSPCEFIDIQGTYTIVEHTKYDNVLMKDMLNQLSGKIKAKHIELPEKKPSFPTTKEPENIKLSAKYIYPRIQDFLKPNDMIFVETGIIPHGFAPTRLPENTEVNTQTLWGSIGWATPAMFGGQLAAKDRRTILLTGEGSHQLTAMEVSNVMKQGLKPIIIVINNDGYTIERVLSDSPDDFFNDIIKWDYSKLPTIFKDGDIWITQARTEAEFDQALKNAEIEQKRRACYIEIFTEQMDLPELTKKLVCKHIKKLSSNP